MSEEDYGRFKQHTEALCFDSGALGSGKVWHFDPRGFIEHFQEMWLGRRKRHCKFSKALSECLSNDIRT